MKGAKPRQRSEPQQESEEFAKAVGRALRRAGRRGRAVAKAHGTPVYYMKNGKVVAENP